jgi:Lactonase, 7-bladed beta-propeller
VQRLHTTWYNFKCSHSSARPPPPGSRLYTSRTIVIDTMRSSALGRFLVFAPAINSALAKTYTYVTGGYTTTVSTLTFDPEACTLDVINTTPYAPTNASWVATHPYNPNLLLATAETAPYGQLATLSFDDKTNSAQVVSNSSSKGADPAYAAFTRDGKFVFIVNVRAWSYVRLLSDAGP